MKILLVDDEEEILFTTKMALRSMHHTVECSSDPASAAQMIEAGDYDLAFIDYKMPVHDGIWFMKNAKIPRHTKVLLMTGFVDRDVINKMFDCGARGYVIKPFRPEELATQIDFHTEHN